MARRMISLLVAAAASALVFFGVGCASDGSPAKVPPAVAAPAQDASTADAAPAPDAAAGDEVDAFFLEHMKAANVPGMAVAIVKGGKTGWAKGYGLAEIGTNRNATDDTLFLLASVSKTVMATALMRLIEDPARGLALDQAIDAHLPFPVRHPGHPSVPITFRMLLTHTSSLVDGAFVDASITEGDANTPLGEWLADAVDKSDAWAPAAPGTAFAYSNTASSLAGYLVETISKTSLEEYCRTEIFDPLGMNETSWFFSGLDPSHVAMPYGVTKSGFVPEGHYGFPDYPDGQLRSSATELARFLSMIAGGGELEGKRILQKATVDAMMKPQVASIEPSQGLVFFRVELDGRELLGHNGAYLGVSTDMWFDAKTGAGFVLLTNGPPYYDGSQAEVDAMLLMNAKLLAMANALP